MAIPGPIGVGDAIALATLAYQVAVAFKSAPSEFADIQSLLYSVGESLKLLARTLPDENDETRRPPNDIDQDTYSVVGSILENCRGALKHLEEFVNKHSILDPGSQADGKRKWRDEIKKNWKRLIWTKDGGDVTKLRQTLTAQTNALNLAATIMNG
jgi:hypothetical protein